MKNSTPSDKKAALALDVDVDREAEPTLLSPLRSASVNPSTKARSIGSRSTSSSRVTTSVKKL